MPECWCCAACGSQDSRCDQNATQNISSDCNCSARQQVIRCFPMYLWSGQLRISTHRLRDAHFSCSVKYASTSSVESHVYSKTFILWLRDSLSSIPSAWLLWQHRKSINKQFAYFEIQSLLGMTGTEMRRQSFRKKKIALYLQSHILVFTFTLLRAH